MLVSSAHDAGWSSMVARRAHNPKVVGSNPAPATRSNALVYAEAFFLPACLTLTTPSSDQTVLPLSLWSAVYLIQLV
jgi:hypothetical protein